jgi:farnesol dehydrogenase
LPFEHVFEAYNIGDRRPERGEFVGPALKINAMRTLVTGGTGYLGSAIVRALERAGHQPIVFARHATGAGLPGDAIDGDVRDSQAVARAIAGTDAVCHTAALVSIWRRRRADFDDVNVQGLRHVLDACRAHGTRRIVYTSSFLALPPAGARTAIAGNDYQRTKLRALEVAREATDLPLVTVFPGVVYGPGPATEGNLVGRLIRDHLAGRLPGIVEPARRWSYAWVDDVADAHVAALERGRAGGEYVLGGDNAAQRRLFEIVREARGVALPRTLPAALAAAAGAVEEVRAAMTGRPPLITRGAVAIFRHDWSLDSARSIDELSLRITPLDRGVRALLAAI